MLLVGFLFHSELTGRERLSLMCGRSEEMWVFAKGKLEAQRITGGGYFWMRRNTCVWMDLVVKDDWQIWLVWWKDDYDFRGL